MIRDRAVVGLVRSQLRAEGIITELQREGFLTQDISVILPDQRTHSLGFERHTKAPEGATAGVATGGVLGGVLGLLAGIGVLAIPGVGPLIAAGPIMAALSGAAAGAATLGIAGALIGMGFPEYEAKFYEGKIREGNILLSVHAPDIEQRTRAKKILEHGGGTDIKVLEEVPEPDTSSVR